MESSVSTTEYTGFDILGRVTGHKQTTDGQEYMTGYTYYLNGALNEQTYPSGRVVKNTFDADGALSQVQSKRSSETYRNFANGFVYNAAGAVTAMKLGNGRWENTTFNSRLQPTQIGLGAGAYSQSLLKLEYSYGTTANNGNVVEQKITVPGVAHPFVQAYTYDELNRLKSATETQNSTQTWKQTFTFDRYGNRNFDEANTTTLVKNCGTAPNYSVCSADVPIVNPNVNTVNNKLTGTTYDAAGNVIEDAEGRQFTYDAENKQVEVENGSSQLIGQYYFDGDGKRVKKVVPNGETTIFVYDASGRLIGEYSTVVQSSQDAKTQYLTADHLGTPRINTNSVGAVVSRSDYMPYGEEITTGRSSGQGYVVDDVRQGFTGYENDDETGLGYAKARMYRSTSGRFSSPDFFANDTDIADTQSWNLYVYVRNNPLNLIDPSGEKVYVGNITNQDDRDEFLRRVNYTYGCDACVTVDSDGYLQIDTSVVDKDVLKAATFLTDAIRSDADDQLYDVQISNNDPNVAWGQGRRGGSVLDVASREGCGTRQVAAIRITLDFGDDKHVRGNEQLRASFLNTVFAHEVAHFSPMFRADPTQPDVRGPVVNAVNELMAARGLPLRAAYVFRSVGPGLFKIMKFGDPVRNLNQQRLIRGGDGIEVADEPGRILLMWQKMARPN